MKKLFKLLRFIFFLTFIVLISVFLKQAFFSSSELLIPETPKGANPILSFAVIGDPEQDLENLDKALELIKQKELEFVVLMGDLTEVGTEEQLDKIKKALEKSKVEYYVIPGNHDLWYGRKLCLESKQEGCINIQVYRKYFMQNYYASKKQGFIFVFLDNSDEWLGMGQIQRDWLNNFLFTSKDFREGKMDQKYFVFSHIPLYHPESDYVVGYQKRELQTEARQMLTEFCEHPPLALFFGHLHHTNDYEYECKNGNSLRMIVAGSIHDKRNWQLPRFLRVDLFSDKSLVIEEIELD